MARTNPSLVDAFAFERWASETTSPRAIEAEASLSWLQDRCGSADAALQAVANRLAAHTAFGARPDDLDRITFGLRASGSPYVWPREWRLHDSEHLEAKAVLGSFERWLESFKDEGERRCGVSVSYTGGQATYAAIVSDVVADLSRPLPTRVRTGQWLELRVKLLREASDAKVVLAGARHEPAFFPASIVHGEVLARFPIKAPGPWLIQVLASMDTGPRPVIDAQVFADMEPPKTLEWQAAPGESASSQGQDLAESLFTMLNAARVEEGRKPLSRDARLDRIANEHALAMLRAGHTGHDVGDGSTRMRLENAGIETALAAENVARAADTARAHRNLWASPSHRSNILHRGFRNVGLGVVRGPDNTVWACELFAALD